MKAPSISGEDQPLGRLVQGFLANVNTIGTQVVPVLFIALIVAVIVMLYLSGASRVAATGYDIRDFEQRRVRLAREEQRLLNRASELQAFTRIERDATARLGLIPATSPDYIRSRPSPIDIDQRLRDAQARTHLENPTFRDVLRFTLHLPGVLEEPLFVKQPEPTVNASFRDIWKALTGNVDQTRRETPPVKVGETPIRSDRP